MATKLELTPKRVLKGFRYAFTGVFTAFRTEHHIYVDLFGTIFILIAAWVFGITKVEMLICILTMGMIWTAELMNTSIEFLTDLVTPDYHPQAKKVKDVAAAAVLASFLTAVSVGLVIFVPYVLEKL